MSGDELTSWRVNATWRKLIADALSGLLNPHVWSGTDAEIEDAQLETNRLINALYDEPLAAMIPISGTILWWNANLPDGFIECDGSLHNVATYPLLFAELGYYFGGADDFFQLPNPSGRTIVGWGGPPFDSVGNTGGEYEHTLTIDEMPAHTHDIPRAEGSSSGARVGRGSNTPIVNLATLETGGGEPHNNMSPYLVGRWIIRAY